MVSAEVMSTPSQADGVLRTSLSALATVRDKARTIPQQFEHWLTGIFWVIQKSSAVPSVSGPR